MKGSEIYRNVAEKLRLLRTLTGVTQQQVADFIHVNRSTYSYYELGANKPPPNVLCALAKYFDVNLGYLTGTETIRTGHKFYKLLKQ